MQDILEVVDSLVESPKCVRTQNEQELKALAGNRANRIVRSGKSNSPISSALTAVRGTIGSSKGILLQAKWNLTRGRDKIHDNSWSCGSD
jgi:hypothetical protein